MSSEWQGKQEKSRNDTVVSLENVSKAFSGKTVLSDLSLSLRRGEITGFLGTNGAGKTTTVKILLGFLKPDAGKVSVFGGSPEAPETRMRIGFMPEIAYYYQYLDIRELLSFYGGLCGMKSSAVRERSEYLIRRVGLGDAGGKRLKTYSKGMLQRAGIAQALLNDPDLLILDEPMTGLDPLARIHFRDLLLELKSQGKTIFFSSHELSEAELICDQVAIIKGGSIVKTGTVGEFAGDGGKNLERLFLGVLGEGREGGNAI